MQTDLEILTRKCGFYGIYPQFSPVNYPPIKNFQFFFAEEVNTAYIWQLCKVSCDFSQWLFHKYKLKIICYFNIPTKSGFPQVLEGPKIWKVFWKVLRFVNFYKTSWNCTGILHNIYLMNLLLHPHCFLLYNPYSKKHLKPFPIILAPRPFHFTSCKQQQISIQSLFKVSEIFHPTFPT